MEASTSLVLYDPHHADAEVVALAGFLAGYGGRTQEAYALDLHQFLVWCTGASCACSASTAPTGGALFPVADEQNATLFVGVEEGGGRSVTT